MASFEVHEEATAAAAWRVTWLPVDVPRQTSRPHLPLLNRVLSRRLIELDGVQAAADAPVMVIAASARADCIGPDDVPRQTSRSGETDQRMPPPRSPGSSRGVRPHLNRVLSQLLIRSVRTDSGTQSAQNRVTFIIPAPPSRNCYGKLCSPLDEPPDPRDVADVFRRRTSESPPSADWNEWQGPPGLFRSVPRITDEETHRRLMSEVEAGTANSAARYYAEMVRRHEEHARRTGGICPSPPRCPGSPLCDTLPIQPTFPQLTMGGSSTPADEQGSRRSRQRH